MGFKCTCASAKDRKKRKRKYKTDGDDIHRFVVSQVKILSLFFYSKQFKGWFLWFFSELYLIHQAGTWRRWAASWRWPWGWCHCGARSPSPCGNDPWRPSGSRPTDAWSTGTCQSEDTKPQSLSTVRTQLQWPVGGSRVHNYGSNIKSQTLTSRWNVTSQLTF